MPFRDQTQLSRLFLGAIALVLLVSTGCIGSAWKQTLEEDTPAAYYRFMRAHADSEFAAEARERLSFHKLYREPTLVGFNAFRRQYPDSALTEMLYPVLQKPAFEAARAAGTGPAYRGFLSGIASGEYAERAEGNAIFVEANGFGGDPSQLATFAERHPTSDFAAEAKRTVAAVAARRSPGFSRVGLVIQIAEATPERDRVREALVDRMRKLTEASGLMLSVLPDGVSPSQVARFPAARLEVRHQEVAVGQVVAAGQLARPAMLATTIVALRASKGGSAIAERRFELRVEDKAYVPGTSVLFARNAEKYWNEFFVPIARWENDQTIRPALELGRPVVDLDGVGDRVVVLYEDGDFDLIGLADPTQPVTLARYERSEDYKKWTGIRVLGDRVAIYGEEGLEFVRFTKAGPVVEKTWNRGDIGRVLSMAPVGDQLVIAGAKGLQLLDPETGTLTRVMRRILTSVDSAGETLVFADGESIYLSTLALLAENRVIAQMKLGKTFGPRRVRVVDDAAIVTGPGGALVIDLRNPQQPRALSKLVTRQIGEVVDATRIRGRTFLVGERGLQLLSRKLDRVEETIDVGPRSRVSAMGRHLVTANGTGIQVVDSSPWAFGPAPTPAAKSNP